ncbi:MAG TPA: discoidin domain-containing protein, partial [Planctomycetota bacterium]|nr:discoidin domain-containing protein [Planctomycetota bacterium]
ADEGFILSLGEVEVYGPLDCPAEGDTTCEGLTVEGPLENAYGTWTITAEGNDGSSDLVLYTFRAESDLGDSFVVGPQLSNVASLNLRVGTWTITVESDDDPICEDVSEGAVCSEVVEVIDPVCVNEGICNLALRGVARQSSTGFNGEANRAIDGDTNGNYGSNTITHTADGDPAPWWELDLRATVEIDTIVLWNRTDCCSQRLSNFRVTLLDAAREEVYSDEFFTDGVSFPDTTLEGFEIFIGGELARYVRIDHLGDISGAGLYVSLAEVQVFGEGTVDPPGPTFVRGDADASGGLNLTDGIFVLNYLFQGNVSPACLDALDSDDSGGLNLTDGIYVLQFLFSTGSPPPAPYPDCGEDSTEDTIECETSHPECA